MREVALADHEPQLAALVAELEATGEPIVLTRDGKAVATLRIPEAGETSIGPRLLANMDERTRRHPASAAPFSWEALKAELDEDRR